MKLTLLLLASLQTNAALLIFTDADAWAAQMASKQITLESFSGSLLSTTGVTQVGGVHGAILNDQWRDSVINHPWPTWPNQPLQTTTFAFNDPTPTLLWGFGANFDTAPGHGGHASGIAIEIGGVLITNLRHQNGDFFGIVATDAASRFDSFTLGTVPACWDFSLKCTGWEIFDVDNLRFATDAPTTHTPEPGPVLLIGAGLLAVGLMRRGRRM